MTEIDCRFCRAACCFYRHTMVVTPGEKCKMRAEIRNRRIDSDLTGLAVSIEENGFKFLAMRREVDGSCRALSRVGYDGFFRCRIYEAMPKACRDVSPGSEQCLRARKAQLAMVGLYPTEDLGLDHGRIVNEAMDRGTP